MNNIYENMGIYDLRNYARELGVKSPTTKNKSQLIYAIENSNFENCATKRGRPPLKNICYKNFDFSKLAQQQIFYAIKQNNEINKALKSLLKLIK